LVISENFKGENFTLKIPAYEQEEKEDLRFEGGKEEREEKA
jgi:hypothetical protein